MKTPVVARENVIPRRIVVCLGVAQVIAWGTMHYLVSVFGPSIQAETGWQAGFVYGGFSCALVVMGIASASAGRWIDRRGGRAAMMAGCWIGAAGCATLAVAHHGAVYYLGWILLGLAMRLALYDAAFAALAHLGGPRSRTAMSSITLFGGFASTVFWPLGQWMAEAWGWRAALLAYALALAASSLLHLALPAHREAAGPAASAVTTVPLPALRADVALYGCTAAIVLFLQSGMAAHLPGMLHGLGWTPATAITLSTLFGLGQVAGRCGLALAGQRIGILTVNLVPCSLLCLAFAAALAAGTTLPGAALFTLLYGAGNGMATIMRGTIPLALFDARQYGRIVGGVLKPVFILCAGAPVVFALAIRNLGYPGTLALMLVMSVALLAAAVALHRRHRKEASP